jgi:hypothetical protein
LKSTACEKLQAVFLCGYEKKYENPEASGHALRRFVTRIATTASYDKPGT